MALIQGFRGRFFQVDFQGAEEAQLAMMNFFKRSKNVTSVLETWRGMVLAAIANNIDNSRRSTKRGGTTAMRGLSGSTAGLRARGISRVGSVGGAGKRPSPLGVRPLLATGDYRNSWGATTHPDRTDKLEDANTWHKSGARYKINNRHYGVMHESGYRVKSRLFLGTFVPPRPVTNVFNKRFVKSMINTLMRHLFQDFRRSK